MPDGKIFLRRRIFWGGEGKSYKSYKFYKSYKSYKFYKSYKLILGDDGGDVGGGGIVGEDAAVGIDEEGAVLAGMEVVVAHEMLCGFLTEAELERLVKAVALHDLAEEGLLTVGVECNHADVAGALRAQPAAVVADGLPRGGIGGRPEAYEYVFAAQCAEGIVRGAFKSQRRSYVAYPRPFVPRVIGHGHDEQANEQCREHQCA